LSAAPWGRAEIEALVGRMARELEGTPIPCQDCGTTERETEYSRQLDRRLCGDCFDALADRYQAETALAESERDAEFSSPSPFALDLDAFIATKSDAPPALIGTEDDIILPALGLGLLVAKGGKGKTTFTVEMALHLASGVDWLGFEVSRPLRILFIENEGPMEPFRRKLERRRAAWPHEIEGAIYIYAQDWGLARLSEVAFIERLNGFCAENGIDLIVGDPLDSLGMDGEGSPSETRAMVDRFKAAGLLSSTAWWVLHHSRKERAEDAIDEASGAWGGRPDAMLGLEKEPGKRALLSFRKLRWGRRDGFALILAYDPESEAFEFVSEASEEERDYAAEIEELLAERPYLTAKEIAAPRSADEPGIGARDAKVKEALEGNPDRFVSLTGEEAKAVGRQRTATVWTLLPPSGAPGADGDSLGGWEASAPMLPPEGGAGSAGAAPQQPPTLRRPSGADGPRGDDEEGPA